MCTDHVNNASASPTTVNIISILITLFVWFWRVGYWFLVQEMGLLHNLGSAWEPRLTTTDELVTEAVWEGLFPFPLSLITIWSMAVRERWWSAEESLNNLDSVGSSSSAWKEGFCNKEVGLIVEAIASGHSFGIVPSRSRQEIWSITLESPLPFEIWVHYDKNLSDRTILDLNQLCISLLAYSKWSQRAWVMISSRAFHTVIFPCAIFNSTFHRSFSNPIKIDGFWLPNSSPI